VVELALALSLGRRHSHAELFARIAQEFRHEVVQVLENAIESEGRSAVLFTSEVLREAPPTVVFEHKAFIGMLLQRAQALGQDEHDFVRHSVLACALTDVGNTPSSYPEFSSVRLDVRASNAAAEEPPESELKDLFQDIAAEAESIFNFLILPPDSLRETNM
jgi:broad specificity phosphatase PhoE